MKRFVRVAIVWLAGTLCIGAVSAHAQTTASSGSDPRVYVEFNGGPTLGHKSDTFIGGEIGLRLVAGLDVFIEGGHMGNAGTARLDTAAAKIATDFLGGTVTSTAKKVNYIDAGIRYHVHAIPVVHPYVLVGGGLAEVKTEATFAVNGTEVNVADRGVQLGGDLSGTTRKTFVVAGVGVNVPFLKRLFVDIGYRYGRIFPKTDDVETDATINTQRVLLGVGVSF
jgi:opacity protein-like surface antigen